MKTKHTPELLQSVKDFHEGAKKMLGKHHNPDICITCKLIAKAKGAHNNA